MQYRKIIHIDMDAFYVSVEQRDNHLLRGKPIAVGGSEERGVVAAASYEARKFGVRSAIPSIVAKRKCPELIFVKPRFDIYKKVSHEIYQIFEEYTDLIEPLSLDEAYLDVTDSRIKKPTATLIANEIRHKIHQRLGLTASAGISFNKFLAKIASDINKPNGFFVIHPDRAQSFIDKLPIGKFHGVGKVTAQKFNELGIFNGRDLRHTPLETIIRNFGRNGRFFHEIAHGKDNRPVEPNRERKSVGAENTFSTDLTETHDLNRELQEICETVFYRLQKVSLWGSALTVKIKYHDFTQITRCHSFSQPVTDGKLILKVASELMHQSRQTDKPIRLLGVSISNFGNRDPRYGIQLELPFE